MGKISDSLAYKPWWRLHIGVDLVAKIAAWEGRGIRWAKPS